MGWVFSETLRLRRQERPQCFFMPCGVWLANGGRHALEAQGRASHHVCEVQGWKLWAWGPWRRLDIRGDVRVAFVG